MDLDSVRELKIAARANIVDPLVKSEAQSLGIRTQSIFRSSEPETIALGIAKSSVQDYVLAVRIQHPRLRQSSAVERLTQLAKGEVNVQYVGAVRKRQGPWYQQRCRPLRIGCSAGHVLVTAGTLGAFVKSRKDNSSQALSNNHVFADENVAHIGDTVLQPGKYDGGQDRADKLGTLINFIALDFKNTNRVDCATALIDSNTQFDAGGLDTSGRLSTTIPTAMNGGETVMKIGRTTGLTRGTITAIEVDNVAVAYDHGQAQFDGQIEISGTGGIAFSQGGDSGSLVFDQDLAPVALLFAGSDQGGSNNMGVTYANPLQHVLDALAVDLLI